MGRPRKISCEQIVETARKLFLEHGVSVPVSVIAKEAGISEGVIFKRFPTKEDLFLAAMCPPEATFESFVTTRAGIGDIKTNIRDLCGQVLTHLRETLPRMMLLFAHNCQTPLEWMKSHPNPPPIRMLKQISRYFDAEKAKGRICDANTTIIARVILGSLHNYAFLEIIGASPQAHIEQDDFVSGLVELIWKGISNATT